MLKEFKEFAIKGNAMDMAVGIIIGAAFGSIIKSLVDDLIMPPLGLLLGSFDFSNFYLLLKSGSTPPPYASLSVAKAAGANTLNYGMFINAVIQFFIISFAVFFLVRGMNRLRTTPPPSLPAIRECPFCTSSVSIKAKRCPHCTSEIQ